MRKRFEEQHKVGLKLISETKVSVKSRDDFPAVVATLKEIFTNRNYNEQIFSILEEKIMKGKKKTGRTGLTLWQIFVLAQIRLGLNIDYDRLEMMVNNNSTLRQLLGIEYISDINYIEISRQRIVDNVSLLDDNTLKKLNEVIIELGYNVFKKKGKAVFCLKTDSFVIESNVHFPTDYNLLWDSVRKTLDIIDKYKSKYSETKDWRKSKNWRKSLRNLSRALGKASASRGKGRNKKIKIAANEYLTKANALLSKLEKSIPALIISDTKDLTAIKSLKYFTALLDKHIDLVERRLLKDEIIPHEDKMFSIFETYTEWISKGKINKKVELGKRLSITTDQYGLIIDYHLHENITDSEIVSDIAKRIFDKYEVDTWSFDKGYWHKDNKELLKDKVRKLIMPKKGKLNKNEKEEEQGDEFKKYRRKHSAVESNINELEHRGLDRCPDRGYTSFKRYIGIGITAYNLHKIGRQIIKDKRVAEDKLFKLRA